MPMPTPSTITKAVISEMIQRGEKPKWAYQKMISLWEEAYPIVRYIDDAALQKKKKSSKKSPAPTDALMSDISFNDVWEQNDISDQAAYAGLGVSDNRGEDTPTYDLNAHIHAELTRSQLARTGFSVHGGIVLTMLKPMLAELGVEVRVGSHFTCRASRYEVKEITSIVKWESDDLYVVANCI